MLIRYISIDRYKSLYDVKFDPEQLSVVAGPNNAGKSNIADALDFLAEVYRFDLNLALQRRGGFENVAYRRVRRTKQAVGFEISAVVDHESLSGAMRLSGVPPKRIADEYRIVHRFSFKAESQRLETGFRVVAENLAIFERRQSQERQLVYLQRYGDDLSIDVHNDDDGDHRSRARRAATSITYPFLDESFHTFLRRQARPDRLLIEAYRLSPLLFHFVEQLAQIRVFQLTPLEARRSGTPTPGAGLERHGANLPTRVAELRRRSHLWGNVLEAMRRVMPGLIDVELLYTPDRRMTLAFEEAGIGRPWSVEEVSDGTIQSLALFVAIVEAPGPLLLIEEPENSLHPWIVRVILDLCREARDKQIVLTTHSPVLLNYVEPNNVFLVWQYEHHSNVARLTDIDPKAELTWNQGNAIFDLLDTGLIPEAVPAGEDYINMPEIVGEDGAE